jgi:1-acyl-sn-glycerol-3-phosphate acyltransferase
VAPPKASDQPLVLFVNHASWWDPLICLLLNQQYFLGREARAPIDAKALKQYRFFARLGFFGVEQGTRRGAVTFLQTAEALLAQPNTTLWLTPQGRFADVRERPVRFAAGLGHLASRVPHACFVPVAIEYPFWEESRPETLIRFGEPVVLPQEVRADDASFRLESALAEVQDALASESLRRQPEGFTSLLEGGAGVGGIYDLWRRLRAWASGRKFRAEHGTK